LRTHGTIVASKAVGAKYGVAKKATLIPVKITSVLDDMLDAFELIADDLDPDGKPGRGMYTSRLYQPKINRSHFNSAMKAVVVSSMSFGEGFTHDTAIADSKGKALKTYMDDIIALGTPIITSAGNHGEERPKIDQMPQVFEDGDFPIINVGAVNYQGKLWSHSQDGDQVTIYAPGDKAEAQSKNDKAPLEGEGTSIAAPAVAGLIATCKIHAPISCEHTLTLYDYV